MNDEDLLDDSFLGDMSGLCADPMLELADYFLVAGESEKTHIPLSMTTIEVFITWENVLAQIEYPDPKNGWEYRADCGSHSQHRWSLTVSFVEMMQLVVRHATCFRALFRNMFCRNCLNRETWRSVCLEPQNIFYVLPVGDVVQCMAIFEPMIKRRIKLTRPQVAVFLSGLPRSAPAGKKVNDQKMQLRLAKLEADIKSSVIKTNASFLEDNLSTFIDGDEADKKEKLDGDEADKEEKLKPLNSQLHAVEPMQTDSSIFVNQMQTFSKSILEEKVEEFELFVEIMAKSLVEENVVSCFCFPIIQKFSEPTLKTSDVFTNFMSKMIGSDLNECLCVLAIKSVFMSWSFYMQKYPKFSVGFYASAEFRSSLITDDWFAESFVRIQHMIYANHKDAFAKDETVFIMGCLMRDGESLPLNVNSDRLTVFGMLKKKTW